MNTAKLIKETRRSDSVQAVYELSPPLDGNDYVLVSAIREYGMLEMVPETYIFPCKRNGEVISYVEMEGSFQGEMNHGKALKNAGYTIIGDRNGA